MEQHDSGPETQSVKECPSLSLWASAASAALARWCVNRMTSHPRNGYDRASAASQRCAATASASSPWARFTTASREGDS